MPVYKLRNLGKYGVITDVPAYDLPPEGWTMANNIRFVANRFEKMGGWAPVNGFNLGTGQVPHVFLQEPDSQDALLFGTSNNLYRYESGVAQSIKNPSNTYTASPAQPWDYTTLSSITVFNNEQNAPQAWLRYNRTDEHVIDLPGWGKHSSAQSTASPWVCKKMRSFKNYLIALNMIEDADGKGGSSTKQFPQRVRWSDVSYVGSLPANWTDNGSGLVADSTGTFPASDGGFTDLADCQGVILDGRPMRDSFMIYTTKETYIMDYIGGQLVFNFRKLFPDSGLLNPNCVCEFEGSRHFVISEDDVFVHDGSTKQSVVTDVIKEYLLSQITSSNYQATKVFAYPTRKEIWVTFTTLSGEQGSTANNYACNKAAIWNWNTNQWSFTDLPNVFWLDSVAPPDTDSRSWRNPDSSPLSKPTKIILDSPIYELPVGQSFRIDVIYKLDEGLGSDQKLLWTVRSGQESYVDLTDIGVDEALNLHALSEGEIDLKVTVGNVTIDNTDPDNPKEVVTPSTDPNLTDQYHIKIVSATKQDPLFPGDPTKTVARIAGDRHMNSDTTDYSYNADGTMAGDLFVTDPNLGQILKFNSPDGKLDKFQDPNEPIPNRTSPEAVANGADAKGPIGPYRPDQQVLYPDPENQWNIINPDGSEGSNKHDNELWEQRGFSFTRSGWMGCSVDSGFYYLDTSTLQETLGSNGSGNKFAPVIAEITRYGIAMAEFEDSLGRHKTWRTIYPLLTGKGTLRFIIGGSEDAYTAPAFSNSSDFTIGQDYKVDCFVNNKFLAVTIRDENEGEWSMSGMDIDFFIGGLR